ncbi:uncharacterized protein LOC126683498 isoform X2 [Mercurialis annua]|uniref:uncharacterized protein LOC126683498 isoform X2 n=1 Tax=Mercurialis annua TaxID=3986 RepID=UPI0024ACFEF7|nr:uncharacterized protein LOC126683498 isoform X2 [Mercurialis annua]
MKRIKTHNEGKPYAWLLDKTLSEWSRHLFHPAAKSDHCTNNMTESFNSWINKIRGMPICKMIDSIRQKCMVRMHKRYAKASTWEGRVTPLVRITIINLIRESRYCKMFPGRNDEFEVIEGKCRFVVKLGENKCSCLWWDRSGIPCKHAMVCIGYKRGDVESYCDEYFTVEKYLATYNPTLRPFPHNDMEEDDTPVNRKLLPSHLKRQPGRPRKARNKQDGETPAGGRIKRSSTVRCKICKQLGHNKRTCGRGPTMAEIRSARMDEAPSSSHVQSEKTMME